MFKFSNIHPVEVMIKTKTVLGGLASIAAGLAGIMTGGMETGAAVGLIMLGFQSIFIRAAINKI